MKRSTTVRVVLAGLVIVAAVAAVAVVLYLGVSASTPPVTDADGHEIPNSIAVLEKIESGGLDQWILIRGHHRANPVLLWLHGGPGGAQMAFAHHVDRALEQRFVVVHWDQRGAGKSNHRGFDEETMRLERYLEDARELIAYLRRRLGQDRVILLGHSWGTRLGMELVKAHPEYFHAYIGVSQVVNHDRATELARDWLLNTIDPAGAPADWRMLQDIEIPARRHSEYRRLNELTDAYGGSVDLSTMQLARIAVRAPEYTVLDYVRLLRGMNRGGRPMHEGGVMAGYDFVETASPQPGRRSSSRRPSSRTSTDTCSPTTRCGWSARHGRGARADGDTRRVQRTRNAEGSSRCPYRCRRLLGSIRSGEAFTTSSEVSWISSRRFTARARRLAASSAIEASPARSRWGTRRSSAAMSSRSRRATSPSLTAMRRLHGGGPGSTPRRNAYTASRY